MFIMRIPPLACGTKPSVSLVGKAVNVRNSSGKMAAGTYSGNNYLKRDQGTLRARYERARLENLFKRDRK
jgi:hypothetical protein